MKAVLPLLAIALLSSCSSTGGTTQAPESDQILKLRLDLEKDKNKMVALHSELTRKLIELEKRTGSLENLVSIYEVDIKRLRQRIEELGGATGVKPEVKPNPEGGMTTAEARMKASLAINDLKNGKMKVDDIVAELKPIASVASIVFVEALATNMRDFEFLLTLETVLSKLPTDSLRVPLQDALNKQGIVRASASRVIGRVGDVGLSRLLETHIDDADPYFCYEIGRSMLMCRNRKGVVPLLRSLRADDKETRMLAIKELKNINKGEALGYDYLKNAADNAASIKQWGEWWDKMGQHLFE